MTAKTKPRTVRATAVARGLRLGQLIVGLETASAALKNAQRGSDLLGRGDQEAIERCRETLLAIEQRAWIAYDLARGR